MARELDETRVGIICLTPENLNAPWILFEAGALSKTLEETYVCPYLLDVRPADLKGPLAQFQAATAEEEDTRKVVQTINRALGDEALAEERVNKAFERWWPELEGELTDIVPVEGVPKAQRSEREILEEVLVSVRAVERQVIEGRKRQEQPTAETRTSPSKRERAELHRRLSELEHMSQDLRHEQEALLLEGNLNDARIVGQHLAEVEQQLGELRRRVY